VGGDGIGGEAGSTPAWPIVAAFAAIGEATRLIPSSGKAEEPDAASSALHSESPSKGHGKVGTAARRSEATAGGSGIVISRCITYIY
jgi:hypothetical protein